MAHNINTMAYVGERPWHGLGTKVPAQVHAAEIIKLAGLDWEVEKRPAKGARVVKTRHHEYSLLPEETHSRYEIVRKPTKSGEQEVMLGTVTARYEPLQNRDAFAFFDPIVDQKQAFFETAGALGDGERVWVMAKMPKNIEVVRGDSCQKYLLLSNTHDGKGSVIVKFTAVRVVCQNTLIMSLEDGQTAYRVRHSKLMKDRLEEVAALIATANKVYEAAAEVFRKMAAMKLEAAAFEHYLSMVFPKTEKQTKTGAEPERWGHIRRIFTKHDDLQLDGVQGSLWAAYNAITYFEDYKPVKEESEFGRLDRVWFGGGAANKMKAWIKARELVTAN